MNDHKNAPDRQGQGKGKKRKILADLHSGMVLLARFADQPAPEASSGSQRSAQVREVLKAPQPGARDRWN